MFTWVGLCRYTPKDEPPEAPEAREAMMPASASSDAPHARNACWSSGTAVSSVRSDRSVHIGRPLAASRCSKNGVCANGIDDAPYMKSHGSSASPRYRWRRRLKCEKVIGYYIVTR